MIGVLLFWLALGVLVYQYVGYPLLLSLMARLRGRPDGARYGDDDPLPNVSLIISAYNEEEVLDRKLQNALDQTYPADKLEIVVVSDGSTDRTNEIARSYADRGVVLHDYSPNRGKNLALNESLPRLESDIVVFTDANGMYRPNAIRELVGSFKDPNVGSVCGELIYENYNENPIAEGYNRYWELDQMQKRMESDIGTLLGANGSIFAVRRELCRAIPNDVCNDMVQPIWVAAAGHACLYERDALSFEAGSRDFGDEIKRRSRIIGRGIRGIQVVWPDIMRRRAWTVGWELLSRKGLRYATPLWFLMLLLGAGLADGPLYKALFVLQLLGYASIPVAFNLPDGKLKRLASPAAYFGIGNFAALSGWWKVLSGSELGKWSTAERPFEGTDTMSSTATPGGKD